MGRGGSVPFEPADGATLRRSAEQRLEALKAQRARISAEIAQLEAQLTVPRLSAVQADIVELVRRRPGLLGGQLAAELGFKERTTQGACDTLAARGWLRREVAADLAGQPWRFFPAHSDPFTRDNTRAEIAAQVAELIRRRPGLNAKDAARELDTPAQSTNNAVRELIAAGLVRTEPGRSREKRLFWAGEDGERMALDAAADRNLRAAVRDFAVTEKRFTVQHVREALAISPAAAQAEIDALAERGVVRPVGRSLGRTLWEYAPPTGAGSAFEAQQRMAAATAPVAPAPAASSGPSGRGLRSGRKDTDDLIRDAQAAGCSVSRAGTGHFVVVAPSGARVTISSTPSSSRSHTNARAALRRAGVRL